MKKLFALIAAVALLSSAACAAYPDKPINMILPTTAGAGWDLAARAVSDKWSELLGQPFQFAYAPGASGQIALRQIISGTNEGYEVSVFTPSMVSISMKVQPNTPANWTNLAYVGNILAEQDAVFVHKESPFKTLKELVEYGREHTLKVSTAHPTAIATLAALVFIEKTGIKANVVSFNSGGQARKALAGKHVDVCVSSVASSMPMKEFFRGLAVFDDKNNAAGIYDMPTMKEALPDIEMPKVLEPFAALVSKEFKDKHPEDYKKLCDTLKEAHGSALSAERAAAMNVDGFMDYWSPEKCEEFVKDFEKTFDQYEYLIRKK